VEALSTCTMLVGEKLSAVILENIFLIMLITYGQAISFLKINPNYVQEDYTGTWTNVFIKVLFVPIET
jgi:hypothetical protein